MRFSKTILATALIAAAGAAYADLVTIQVDAQVTGIYDPANYLGSSVQPGSPVTGSYTYESNSADSDGSPEYGFYNHAPGPYGFDLDVAGLAVRSVPGNPFHIFISNSYRDGYHVHSDALEPHPGGAQMNMVHIGLESDGPGVFAADLLPPGAPQLGLFATRDLIISGITPGGQPFNINAVVTGLGGGSQVPTNASGYRLDARVLSVNDPGNLLGGTIQVNTPAQGKLLLRTDVADQEPAPEYGRYPQPILSGLGFDLDLGGQKFRSGAVAQQIDLFLYNGSASDYLHVASFGNEPLANGSSVAHIDLDLQDQQGNALTGDLLNDSVLLNPQFEQKKIMIAGGSPDGMQSYHIELEVNAIEPDSVVKLSPAGGSFDRMQQFDLGVLFAQGVPPPRNIAVMVNGMGIESACLPGAPNIEQRYTLVCPGVSGMLHPGINQVTVDADIEGRVNSDSAVYEVIE